MGSLNWWMDGRKKETKKKLTWNNFAKWKYSINTFINTAVKCVECIIVKRKPRIFPQHSNGITLLISAVTDCDGPNLPPALRRCWTCQCAVRSCVWQPARGRENMRTLALSIIFSRYSMKNLLNMGKESGKSPFHEPDPKFRQTAKNLSQIFELIPTTRHVSTFLNILNKECSPVICYHCHVAHTHSHKIRGTHTLRWGHLMVLWSQLFYAEMCLYRPSFGKYYFYFSMLQKHYAEAYHSYFWLVAVDLLFVSGKSDFS